MELDAKKYIVTTIRGFESAMYKMIHSTLPDKIKLLKDINQPFIVIFKDAHEKYYTDTFNSFITKNDTYVTEIFDLLQSHKGHSKQCLLNILSQIAVSVHFNLDRKKFDVINYDSYMKSVTDEIVETLSVFDIVKLFNHECNGVADADLVLLKDGQKFITIDIKMPTERQMMKNDEEQPDIYE
jgi:hypothetical protein